MPDNKCLRCLGTMHNIGIEKVQLGQTGLLLGMRHNIVAGSLEVEIHICSECGKVEFYSTSSLCHEDIPEDIPQKTCPECGSVHDFDFPKCPNCKHEYIINTGMML